jgi:probable rRNA maturation factor
MCPHSSPERPQPPDSQEAVSVQVDERYTAEVDAEDLARAVAVALSAEGHGEAEVTLLVTGDEEVRALNLQFLGEDNPTDVLSFPAIETSPAEAAPPFVAAPEAASYLGDIVIAYPYARHQAEELGRSVADELRLLAVHGTLHLLGYDHAEPEEETAMWARQNAILAQWG